MKRGRENIHKVNEAICLVGKGTIYFFFSSRDRDLDMSGKLSMNVEQISLAKYEKKPKAIQTIPGLSFQIVGNL